MSPARLEKVRHTWVVVQARNDLLAQRFYQRLFQLDPSLRLLFGYDMSEQRRQLMRTIGILVRGLHRPERIRPVLCFLGRRHAAYGVQATDYAMVREALLWALADLLGGSFTEDVRQAWTDGYDQISAVILSAAEENEPACGL